MSGEQDDRLNQDLDAVLHRVDEATRESLSGVVDPAAGLGQLAERLSSRPNQPPRGPRRRVVVAEDQALVRLDLAQMLFEVGYEVVGEAGDGETAVRLARELAPDLVILDVKLPNMDGLTAAERIGVAQLAPVIVLTSFSQRDLVERTASTGAMAYLVKPFQTSDLVPAIEIALSRFAEITSLESEAAELTERLATRKAVDRAKHWLMAQHGMTEPQAFRWIQRSAKEHGMTMRQVADRVLGDVP